MHVTTCYITKLVFAQLGEHRCVSMVTTLRINRHIFVGGDPVVDKMPLHVPMRLVVWACKSEKETDIEREADIV